MDLLTWQIGLTSMIFIRRLNRGNVYFKTRVFKFVVYLRYESCGKIQNFSSISLKLCLLGKKKHRDMGCEYHY